MKTLGPSFINFKHHQHLYYNLIMDSNQPDNTRTKNYQRSITHSYLFCILIKLLTSKNLRTKPNNPIKRHEDRTKITKDQLYFLTKVLFVLHLDQITSYKLKSIYSS